MLICFYPKSSDNTSLGFIILLSQIWEISLLCGSRRLSRYMDHRVSLRSIGRSVHNPMAVCSLNSLTLSCTQMTRQTLKHRIEEYAARVQYVTRERVRVATHSAAARAPLHTWGGRRAAVREAHALTAAAAAHSRLPHLRWRAALRINSLREEVTCSCITCSFAPLTCLLRISLVSSHYCNCCTPHTGAFILSLLVSGWALITSWALISGLREFTWPTDIT